MLFFTSDFYFYLFFQEIHNVILVMGKTDSIWLRINLTCLKIVWKKFSIKKIVTCLSHRDSHGINMTESSKNSEFILSNKLCHWKLFPTSYNCNDDRGRRWSRVKRWSKKNKYFPVKW